MSKSNFDSYPPLFRPTNQNQKLDSKNEHLMKDEGNTSVDLLPIIDMQCLDIEKLDKVCKEWGIFRLVNHEVPTSLLSSLQDHAKEIFNLSFEAKQGLIGSCPMNYFWGTPSLTQAGAALQKKGTPRKLDWMEGLNIPFSQLHQPHPLIDDHPLMNDFRCMLEDYKIHVTRLASIIYEAMMESLKIKLQDGKSYLDVSMGLIRVYRYPRHCTGEDVKGLHGHTDSSILSILSEDEAGGLQFFKDDKWIRVKPIPDTLIVNLGDMMQAVSDDKYKSVKHKVELNKQKERVSVCYFVFPEENTIINTSKYKPFTYRDFRGQVQHDLQTFGRKIGLHSFKLPLVS